MEISSQCGLRVPRFALLAPPLPYQPRAGAVARATRVELRFSSLMSSWLTGAERQDHRPDDKNSLQTTIQTFHAPLESFEKNQLAAADNPQQRYVTEEAESADLAAGLLCLDRYIPDKTLSGLRRLADNAAPFKVEVLHSSSGRQCDGAKDEGRGWLDNLTGNIRASSNAGESRHEAEEWRLKDLAGTSKHMKSPPAKNGLDPKLPRDQQQLDAEAQEAVRWLKADIQRVASVFAREVSVLSGEGALANAAQQVVKEDESAVHVTVKLELLRQAKCPRFHLDKVPIRMICTYVGPSTEWLDGYDKWEMENNRSLPPSCNLKISGGREVRRARPGDVLLFRGQSEGGGGAFGVAHRSPDMVEGQRRLVLTLDAGDIISSKAAASPSF